MPAKKDDPTSLPTPASAIPQRPQLILQVPLAYKQTCSLADATWFFENVVLPRETDPVAYTLKLNSGTQSEGMYELRCERRVDQRNKEVLSFNTVGVWLSDYRQNPLDIGNKIQELIAQHTVVDE